MKKIWVESNVRNTNRHLKPDGLLIGTVFYKVLLSESIGIVVHKVQFGIIVTRGHLKLCKRSGDLPRCSRGGVAGPVTLKLENEMKVDGCDVGESRDSRC